MHAALLAMCTDRISHAAFVSQDVYGAPTYAVPVTHPARVEFKVRRMVDHTGQERVSRARVFFNGDVVIDLRDRLVLPDGTAPPILALYGPRDLRGVVDHWEVSF